MLPVDTNIIFPLILRSSRTDQIQTLLELDHDWRIEPFALQEISNILATHERNKLLSRDEVFGYFAKAQKLLDNLLHPVPDEVVLDVAMQYKITTYDARFLAVAKELGTRLVTEDRKLRNSAPNLTQSLDDALIAAGLKPS